MKELSLHYQPATDGGTPSVQVMYRAGERSQLKIGVAPFSFTVSAEERGLIQWYLEEYLIYPWGEFCARAEKAEALMARLGTALFEAIFATRATLDLYANVKNELAKTRITIHASDPLGISLPWELLRDPALGEYGDLARLAHSFVRSQPDLAFEPAAPPPGERFNILLVIARPGGAQDVPFQSIARRLLELFHPHRARVQVDVLRPPTFERLAQVLGERPNHYHVLHFDGHGAFPQGGAPARFYGGPSELGQACEQGRLLFEGEDGRPREVSGVELGGLLAGKGVPVVLLNACQSGMTRPESLYPSVGNQLLQAGASGVVAMAYSVYVSSAARFMARLYEGLINGEELARAVSLAREDLRAHPQRFSPRGEIPLQDWVVPVLFEAAAVQAVPRAAAGDGLKLDLAALQGEQARPGAEIDCPPPPAFGFVGRDNLLLDLERAFRGETIVLLEGMAGVGKTEAAAGFARWWAETGALDGPIFFFRFEHYLPLAGVCDRVGGMFNREICQQLGQEWHLLDVQQRRQVVLQVLRQKSCLMVWDNFEPVAGFPSGSPSAWTEEEQREMAGFLSDLRGGVTRVLITSRRDEAWLGPIYRKVTLGGLNLVEAQDLAVRVLRRAGLDPARIRGLEQYNDLLKFLHGNPMAIQVILPELARRRPGELLDALHSGEAHLAANDQSQGRERSLAGSLTYRLDALDPILHRRLGILALFQGFVDADVLAWICDVEGAPDLLRGLGRDEWVALLEVAAEVGLLRALGGGFYTVHPALPWFFHELLQANYPDHLEWLALAFSKIYAGYGKELFKLFEENSQTAMTLLQVEENNLLIALRIARQRAHWDEVENILYGINRLFTIQGRWDEWERMVTELEVETEGSDSVPLLGREGLSIALLGHRSEIAHYRLDFKTAESVHKRLKTHYQEVNDEKNLAVALHQLGVVAQERQLFDDAERWYRQSLEIYDRIGNEHGQASNMLQLGVIAQERWDHNNAERWYCQSLNIWKRIGNEHGQAITMHQLGNVTFKLRQFEEAEHWYRQSLVIKQRLGEEQGQAGTLHQLGMLAQERRLFDVAERWYRQSLAIKEHIGDAHGLVNTLHQLGMVAQERRQFEEAERWYRYSLTIWDRIGDEYGQANTLHQLGNAALERQQFDDAERWYRQSLAIKERIGDEHGRAQCLGQLGTLARERRQFDEAENWYHQTLAIMERIRDNHGQAQTLHNLGMVAQEQRQFNDAERWYRQSLAIREHIGDEYGQAGSLHQLGMVAELRADPAQALQFYRQAETIFERWNDPYTLEIVHRSIGRVQGGCVL